MSQQTAVPPLAATRVKTPPEYCSRYQQCSVALCPLDPDQDKRVALHGEPRCDVEKGVRVRAAQAANWPGVDGLKPLERAALARESKLSAEAKAIRAKMLADVMSRWKAEQKAPDREQEA